MRNMMKKLSIFLLTLCLAVPCFTMITNAASGRIMFTDPTTKVGEIVEVKGVLEADDSIEDRTIVMSYDTSMLKFTDGENVTETADGQLTYGVSGTEDGTRVEYLMHFEVLKEGSTKIEVVSYNAWTTSDERIDECTVGYSTVTIEEGDATTTDPTDDPVDTPASDATVEVNGKTYTFVSEFEDSEIPEGFERTTMEYNGSQYNVVASSAYGVSLGYLVDSENNGQFFMYIEDNATFAPYAEIKISDETSIILLSDVSGIQLPETYAVTTVTVNNQVFPAWQNTESSELCILYAVNTNGVKSLYQYDTVENTYQKFTAPAVETETVNDFFIGKLSDSIQDHLDIVILATGIGFIFFVVLVIVLAVKLHNRNAELDEIYDEYGIDLEDEEQEEVKVAKKSVVRKEVEDDEEDEEDFLRIDTEVEDDVTLDEKEDTEEIPVQNEIVEDDDDDDFATDLSNILKEKTASHQEEEDEEDFLDDDVDESSFEIDFIDLDD